MTVPHRGTWHEDVKPEPDSKLEQLAAMYDEAKAAFDEAQERYEQVKAALKSELVKAAPGKTSIRLVSQYLDQPLQLTAKQGRTGIDSKLLRAEQPEIYERYSQNTKPHWELRVAKS